MAVLTAAGAAVGVIATVGLAAIPGADGTITACYKNVNGQLRVIDADTGSSCLPSETQLTWSQTGPEGPPGEPPPVLDRTLWISPLDATIEEPGLQLERGFFGNTLRVTASEPGDLQWVDVPLALPSDLKIKQVTVCYSVEDETSFISQVRLSKETVPPTALVVHDDGTDLTSTTPTCATSAIGGGLTVDAAFTLSLRLDFASTDHEIDIGAVGLLLGE